VDENTGRISGDGVEAHHDVGVAALLEVRIEDRFAGRAPAPPPLPPSETDRTAPEFVGGSRVGACRAAAKIEYGLWKSILWLNVVLSPV
jgi:hypothetical protein